MARSGCCRSSRSTGSEPGRWAPTPSDEIASRRGLSEALRALESEPVSPSAGPGLAARRAAVIDGALTDLFSLHGAEGLALAAVGGYGRGELSPRSDVDLLLLHRPGSEERAEEAFAPLLYPLWDAGIRIGHAIRTPDECREESERRLDSLAALVDTRLVCGDARLVQAARSAARQVAARDPGGFLDGLRQWRIERRVKAGALAEALEPDLKECVGGLRDLHLLGWLVVVPGVAPGLRETTELSWASRLQVLEAASVLRPSERRWALDAATFLLSVREALQRGASHPSNRLVAEAQEGVARALGIQAEERWEARDVLLRGAFELGRRVDAAASAALDRAGALVGEPARHVPSVDWTSAPWPVAALMLFARVAHEGGRVSPDDLDVVERGAQNLGSDRWPKGTLDALVDILAAGEGGVEAMELMDALGLLPALLPEWRGVRGRPQRDPYHRYPVDVHLLRTTAAMAKLLHHPGEPFASRAASLVDDARVPLLGSLLHDAGKAGRGSHVDHGVDVARSALDRMGLTGPAASDVLFLVAEHLLLSDTATRRDLGDEDLILRVAARVGDARRLGTLYLLTMADASATGPGASTPWRLTLIRELVAKVERAFERGLMDPDLAGILRRKAEEVRARLATPQGEDPGVLLNALPPSYVQWVDPADAPVHLDLLRPPPHGNEIRTHRRPGRLAGTYLVTVAAEDRLGLLAGLAGAMTLSGLSILSAQAFTTHDQIALDAFEVRAVGGEVEEDRWRRLEVELARVAEGLPSTAARILELRSHHRRPSRPFLPDVWIDRDGSDFFTVVEVGAPDRIGLLFDLARAFAELATDVHAARVATYGSRVIDVFYVTAADGEKVTDPERVDALRKSLAKAADPGGHPERV